MSGLSGFFAFVANIGSGSVTAIYLQTGRKIKDIPTGEGAEGIAFSPRGQRALVTAAKSGEVVAIDPQAKREMMRKKLDLSVVAEAQSRLFGDRFAASPAPVGLLFAPSGRRAYVAATQSDRVIEIDTESLDVVR